ncbi:uncharacterized protein [Choristoneura fumiferana]|uniref:uncharacterized protein n=1 Tax=Choristoneura fumiferana TaxID=7141 RepID=UPI003D153B99
MRRCEICGIQEKHCENKMFFARFPLSEHVCKQWVKVVGNEISQKSKTRLKKKAIPKLGLPMPPLSEEILEGFPLKMARTAKVQLWSCPVWNIYMHSLLQVVRSVKLTIQQVQLWSCPVWNIYMHSLPQVLCSAKRTIQYYNTILV